MTPQQRQDAEYRFHIVFWLVMVLSVGMYFVVIRLIEPRDATNNPTFVNILLILAIGFVGLSIFLKSHFLSRAKQTKRNFSDLNLTQGGTLPGQLVGNFAARGFLRDRDGNFTFIDAPDAWSTVLSSINDRGDVAGGVTTGTFQPKYHGMVRFASKEDDSEEDGHDDQSQE